jgi:hypothetical protein
LAKNRRLSHDDEQKIHAKKSPQPQKLTGFLFVDLGQSHNLMGAVMILSGVLFL